MRFRAGEVVTYRELWGDRVMTAMPLRVVADSGNSTVLYLAAETTFRAARAPGGGPVRDVSDWASVQTTWTGGSLLRLLQEGLWYCVDVEFDAERRFAGYYVNFQEPVRRTARGFDTVDLVLDVEVAPDGAARIKDADDLDAAVADGHVPTEVASRVQAQAASVRRAIADCGAPLGADRWVGWRAPAEWEVPTLNDGWQEIHG